MVDTKKEQERDELHRAIWAIADELRGAVDGWDFKNYVLGTMFYRYISENLTSYINNGEIEAGNTDFDFAQMSDEDAEEAREGLVEEKGFFILPSELFANIKKKSNADMEWAKAHLNEKLEAVFRHIEESSQGSEAESDFAGLFADFDVNSNKLGSTVAKRNEKLVKIIYVFLTIFLYLPKCPQSLILSALRAFCFCGKPHISRSIFLYFPCQSWLKSW